MSNKTVGGDKINDREEIEKRGCPNYGLKDSHEVLIRSETRGLLGLPDDGYVPPDFWWLDT